MGAVRLELRLSSHTAWIKVFDPRDWTIVVPTSLPLEQSAPVWIDLDVDGWAVALRGTVVGHRDEPAAVVVALAGEERSKINYLNGFIRGGLLNRREKRRLPLKLAVTYGAIEGPTSTFTKDLNDEGVFLFTDRPLPEGSQVHMLLSIPGRAQPLSLVGEVSHTIIEDDDEQPGMGIVFELDAAGRAELTAAVAELAALLDAGKLPASALD